MNCLARLFVGTLSAVLASAAIAQLNAKQCFFAECAVGDAVVTTPSAVSTPACSAQGVTLYMAYVTRRGAESDKRVETELRLQAGVRNLDEARKKCHATAAGQRATVIELGAYKTGLLRVAPVDGSPPYWLSAFDVSRP